MSKVLLVCGHGPGISASMARRYGAAGYAIALVARSATRVEAAAAALRAQGIRAAAFVADMADPAAMAQVVAHVGRELGAVSVVHWNGYAATAGDLTTAPVAEVRRVLDTAITGLVATLQAALPGMKGQPDAALLVTGGGFAFYDPAVDAAAVGWNAMGLAMTKAAQHKLVGMLHQRLRGEGVYVGEVVVQGLVKGTAFDSGNATLDPDAIAQKFESMHRARAEASVVFS